jgi:hypothetical protein
MRLIQKVWFGRSSGGLTKATYDLVVVVMVDDVMDPLLSRKSWDIASF